MYSKYDEAQFHLRMTHELHAKIKERAKANRRSINAEITATLEDSLSKPHSVMGYRDEDEKIASEIADKVRDIAFEIIKKNK